MTVQAWYYATGVPGWARFGHGPVWQGPQARGYEPYPPAPSREQEIAFLRRQAEWLKQEMDAVGRRIEELEQEE